jgi:lysophospholipid acyltransferase (LPLAT)-like uncharacterized protein
VRSDTVGGELGAAGEGDDRGTERTPDRRGTVARALALRLAANGISALGATLRLDVRGADRLAPFWSAGCPLIYVLWHGRILMAPWVSAELQPVKGGRRVMVLASRSRDGEMLARYVERFGLGVVRGSSSRGGASGFRLLAAAVKAGHDVAIAPDGPRGPAGRVQPGVVALAALTGAPVIPLGFAACPAKVLRTWDRFVIPVPFGRAAAIFGPPIAVAAAVDRDVMGRTIETALNEVTAAAEHLAARARP